MSPPLGISDIAVAGDITAGSYLNLPPPWGRFPAATAATTAVTAAAQVRTAAGPRGGRGHLEGGDELLALSLARADVTWLGDRPVVPAFAWG